jgi:GT2 family glycosyltransferase
MSTMSTPSAAVAIATYERPELLERCLQHWERSSRLPDQLLVVDASAEAERHRQRFLSAHPRLFASPGSDYVAVGTPSSAGQRNVALDLARTDVILFVDDDSRPHPSYLEKVVEVFEADSDGRIGGVEGADPRMLRPRARLHTAASGVLRHFARRIGASRRDAYPPGVEVPASVRHLKLERRRSLHGAKMSFRTDLARSLRFDPHMLRYSYCEDFDLSFRVGRTHALVARLDAPLSHRREQVSRPSTTEYFLLSWVNPAYLTEKLLPGAGNRRPLDRLLRLSRARAGAWPPGPGRLGTRRARLEPYRVVRAMVDYVRSGPRSGLVERFAAVQDLIFAGGPETTSAPAFARWAASRPPAGVRLAAPVDTAVPADRAAELEESDA